MVQQIGCRVVGDLDIGVIALRMLSRTMQGLTPFEYINKIWTSEPDRFKLDPTPHPGTKKLAEHISDGTREPFDDLIHLIGTDDIGRG